MKKTLLIIYSFMCLFLGARADGLESLGFSPEDQVVGSDLDLVYRGEGQSFKARFLTPSGHERLIDFILGDDSGYLEGKLNLEEVGTYKLESISVDGLEEQVEGVSIKSLESIEEALGQSLVDLGGIYVDDDLEDYIEGDSLLDGLTRVKFYDDKGQTLDAQISLSNDEDEYLFTISNDGVSKSINVLTSDMVKAGTYSLTYECSGKSYTRDLEIGAIVSKAGNSSSKQIRLERLAGQNRFLTANEISARIFTESKWAVLTNGESYADTLAGVSLASSLDAPVLFAGKDSLNADTRSELLRLGVEGAYVIGGSSAMSPRLVNDLEAMGLNVVRISGKNVIDTSLNIAEKTYSLNSYDQIILASQNNFADALSASAYSAKMKTPIIFTDGQNLETDLSQFVLSKNIKDVIVVGGPNSISDRLLDSLRAYGIGVQRFFGATRYETSENLAKNFYPNANSYIIASGEVWPDAVVGGLLVKTYQAPILLSQKNKNPAYVKALLRSNLKDSAFVLGGVNSLSENVTKEIEKIAKDKTHKDQNTLTNESTEVIPAYQIYKERQERLLANRNPGPIRIFLDQGHGWNYNPGVVKGYYEGVAMYWYGLMLRNELRTYGFEVECIRNDIDKEREECLRKGLPATNGDPVALRGPQSAGYDLLVSLHTNAHNNSGVSGTEVYDSCQSPTYDLASALANTVASHFGHSNRGVRYRYDSEAHEWVVKNKINKDSDRYDDYYGVLRTAGAPRAMMIEHGYHTNWSDCSNLMDKTFKDEMAKKVAKTIADYYGYTK